MLPVLQFIWVGQNISVLVWHGHHQEKKDWKEREKGENKDAGQNAVGWLDNLKP